MNSFARWTRTVGARALWPCVAMMSGTYMAASWGVLRGNALMAMAAFQCLLLMTIPLSAVFAFVPGETPIEQRARERRQARQRSELHAATGMTPAEYIATISPTDVARRIAAAERFGVDLV